MGDDGLDRFKHPDMVNTTPELRDLHRYIISQHAPKWKVLGTLLGLPSTTLSTIEHDNGFACKSCCRSMLLTWQQYGAATWGKLLAALESPTFSSNSNEDVPGRSRVSTVDDGGLEQFKHPDKRKSRPLLKDLMQHFTPRYAAHWETIGIQLGLGAEKLKYIKHDYSRYPDSCFRACNTMLEEWLGKDVTASWTKLFSIIESLEVHHASGEMTSALDQSRDKGMSGPLRVSDLDDGGLEQFKEPDKVNTRPSVRDLYKHVTPRYAADWKVIGTLLGITRGELDAIEVDHSNKDKDCCRRMLQKWLDMDRTASWEKLFTVTESPAVCHTSNKVTLPLAQSSDKGISGSLRSTDVDDGGLEQFKNPDKVNTKPLLRDLYKHILLHVMLQI